MTEEADLDARIVAALQLNGRAPWSAVARWVGVSEATVVRRVAALRASADLRVIGVVDVLRCGLGVPVIVRLRSRPGTAEATAATVASHPETRYVSVLAGGVDCAAELVLADYEDLARLLDSGFLGPDVLDVESMTVMRTFTSNHDWDPGVLGADATRALRGTSPAPFEDRHHERPPEVLDDLDLAVVAGLSENGRTSYTDLAATLGTSESTVRRRVDSLVRRGCLRFRLLAEPGLFGFGTEFMLWISVEPSHLDEAARSLAEHATTRYLSATTGPFDLVAQVALRHYGELYRHTIDVVGALPGVRAAETTLQLRTLKRAWTPTPARRRSEETT